MPQYNARFRFLKRPVVLRAGLLLAVTLLLFCIGAKPAAAQQESLIRDDEIERTLKGWLRPVIVADNLDPDAIRIILVQSPQINAFVAGGQNIFIYTGLLLKTDSPYEVIGVMAHELGHIAGGHLVRGTEEMRNASFEALLGAIVGIGAAAVSGNAGGAAVGIGAASSMAQGNFLAFSRVQESSADQAGLSGMKRAHVNPSGMLSFLQKLQGEELLPASQQDKYVQTHPLSGERIDAVQNAVSQSPYKDVPATESMKDQHARMKAKLVGFISPEQVTWNYPDSDRSIAARYARAIAAYRQNHVDDALKDTDGLLQSEPNNPWFMELKGQMLVDFGRVAQAVPYYRKAVTIVPDAGLVRIAYANALLESTDDGNRAGLQQAADQLERAVHNEPRSTLAQHLLATAYGRMGQEPVAKLHLAEEGALKGDTAFARSQANAALRGLKTGSPDWLAARDLLSVLDQQPDRPRRPRP